VRKSLDPRSVTAERVAGGIFSTIFSLASVGGMTTAVLLAPMSGRLEVILLTGAATLSALVMVLNYVWHGVSHRHKSYTVHSGSIEIRKGVIWRTVISIPRSRVQHTDVSQGPLERRFGLGTLVTYTAGTEHSKASLSGLPHDVAARIRDHLLPIEESDAV
jgi:membrane protein YdbS with pleckstrin-like domain